ncbi:MAG TPA: ABC transporter substrate-binding protein [Afipia sp.]
MKKNYIAVVAVTFVALGTIFGAGAKADAIVIKDVTGREIKLPHAATKIVLAEGRQIVALSLIHPQPVSLLAGWLGDFKKNDSQTYALFKAKFPQVDAVPVLGVGNDGTFPVERAIALLPDVAVLGVSFAPGGKANDIAAQFEAAGIPVVFTDFTVNPFDNTVPSLRILGQVVGRSTEADAFIAFYQAHMKMIADRLAGAVERPKLLLESHAGMGECCFSPGRQNIGRFIDFAGADSISASVLPGASGHIDREYIIAKNPDIYIATGGAHLAAVGGLVIGPGYPLDTIRERLREVSRRAGLAEIKAVQDGNVHGLFHNLLATPLHILAVENIAKWAHPALFADLDPSKSMDEINRRFLAVPMEGVYWASLDKP